MFDVSARLWVQSKVASGDVGDSHQSANLFQSFMTYFNSPILTACEILKSTSILEEAINELKDKLPPDKVPNLGALKTRVKVDPVRDTDILAITYQDTDAQVAIEVVQAILDSFLKLQTQQTTYSAMQSKSFLQSQIAEANKDLKKMDEQIRQFEIKNQVVDLQGEVEDLLKQRGSAEQALREAQARSQEAREKVSFLESRLGVSADDALAVNAMANDPVVAQARKQLADLQFQYSEMSSNYRPEHPAMKRMKSLIARLEKASAERLGVMLRESGINKGGTAAPALTGMREDMMKQMASARSDELAQQSRISSLKTEVVRLDAEVSKLPAKQLELADMLRAQKVIFERISTLEANLGSAKLIEAVNAHTPNFQVIDRPQVVNVTVASRRPKLLVGFGLGLLLGAALFFLMDRLDPRLRRISAVLETLPLPVVGWMGQVPGQLSQGSLESMHRVRIGLRPWLSEGRGQIVVTSGDIGDGKSIVSTGLALSFAQSGLKVLLVDTNLASPSIHKSFKGISPSPGLSDYLAAPDSHLWPQITRNPTKNLTLIPAGSPAAGQSMLLSSDRIAQFIEMAKSEADVVIYDTPPLSETAAALALLSPKVNLLVVVRLNHTHQPALRLLATQIKQCNFAGSGMILANVDDDTVATALARSEQEEELEPA
jgi:capsular exopolysaccharide synthesis family protein